MSKKLDPRVEALGYLADVTAGAYVDGSGIEVTVDRSTRVAILKVFLPASSFPGARKGAFASAHLPGIEHINEVIRELEVAKACMLKLIHKGT